MFRLVSNFRFLSPFSENMNAYQTVRWIRKPRKPLWMPRAKSKLFKIAERPQLPFEESEEIKRLYNNYRTSIKSIRRYLTFRYSVLLQAKADTAALKKAFEEDFSRCSQINNEWNDRIRIEREKRLESQLAEQIAAAEKKIMEIEQINELKLAQAEEIVRKEKEASANFITPEVLDEVIEKAINNPVDYNFAIDLDGNRIVGRETKPESM